MTTGMRYEKENTNVEEKVGGGSADSCPMWRRVKVLLTIAFCGWRTLIILLLTGLPVHARVVSQYSFSFPVRNRQCLEDTCGNAPNYYFPCSALHNTCYWQIEVNPARFACTFTVWCLLRTNL